MAQPSPTSRSRQGPGTSWIVQERERPGLPPWWFLVAVFLMGAGVATFAIVFGASRPNSIHAEGAFADGGGIWEVGMTIFGIDAVRIINGVLIGATVVATGFVTRRLTHSPGLGTFAALLVAMDPSLLTDGQLAVPMALLRFAAVSSLALAFGGHPLYHWMIPIPIIVGALIEPRFLLWGAGLVFLLLLRGHIFASPRHLRDALLQGLVVPLIVLIPSWIIMSQSVGANDVACGSSFVRSGLLLDAPHYAGGIVSIANPIVAIGGIGVLAALAIGALGQVGGRFRLARLPGRIQLRLPSRLARMPSRALWLMLFAFLMPVPQVALILGAVAIALGIGAFMDDTPAFGVILAVSLIGFSAVILARLAPILIGDASSGDVADILSWLPWINPVACHAP